MRLTPLLVLSCLLPALAHAQEFRPPIVELQDKTLKPLTLAKADVNLVITGYIAQTTMTLTFKNDNSRVLEGQLVFPLPDGAAVTGYGLDVNGEMVDGVPVEKAKARVAFETEVRKGVDPGIVEHVKGNNFRTRLYPIPANGTRTVKVQYQSELIDAGQGAAATIPLNWDQTIDDGSLRIEVVQAPGQPEIAKSSFDKFNFEKEGNRYIAQRKFQKVKFIDNIVVALPNVQKEHAVVEKFTSEDGSTVGHFFVINDRPILVPREPVPFMADAVAIVWDASLSRADADKAREIDLLKTIFDKLQTVNVDLIVLRNEVSPPETFRIEKGDSTKLIEAIKALPYDGATNLGALKIVRNKPNIVQAWGGPKPADYNFWILFTDGLGNLGNDLPAKLDARAFTITSDPRANHTLLRYVAQSTGGQYCDLQRMKDADVITALTYGSFSFIRAEYDPKQIADVYPRPGQIITGRFTATGKLLADEAKIVLHYGFAGREINKTEYTLKRDAGTNTGLAPRAWAQARVADLAVFPEKNDKELLAIGQQFNIVTPNTSLIVLETLDQYLAHHITPPRSREAMYKQYNEAVEKQSELAKKVEQEKLTHILALWDARVKWWETEFKYPKNFKFVDVEKEKLDRAVALTGAAPAAPPPAAVRTPAAANGLDGGHPFAGDASGPRYADLAPEKDGKGDMSRRGPSITIKPWSPDTPYLKAMKSAGPEKAYDVYLSMRKDYAASPAYYLDCGDFLLKNGQKQLGLRVLSDIVELQLDSAPLIRIAAHKLAQAGEFDAAIDLFEKVLKLRPEEPQSSRDLALVLADRADAKFSYERRADYFPGVVRQAALDYCRALDLLHQVVMNRWDRFDEIEVIALMEANRLIARAAKVEEPTFKQNFKNPFITKLVKNLDCDVRILLTWDADMTDIDLWVTEPSGEKCFYGHNRTTIGGAMSKDFTQGYGPEEYILRKMMPGAYKIQCNFYGSSQQTISGPCTVQATVITNFGRENEKRQTLTLQLKEQKEVVDIGEVKLGE